MYLGSFDPVHNAHIDIPLKIKKQYHLDKIIYVPTGISPVGKIFKASKFDRIKMKFKIRIATRKSKLALCQVEIVKSYFDLRIETEILEVTTAGDQILNKSLSEIGGKGLFIKELENFILDGSADIAVHSMKDMETEIAQNTQISAVLPRGDRSDVLLGKYSTLDDLPYNAVIGTSSVRRAAFTKSYRPDLVIKLLRGNVGTRIQKLKDGHFDAIILAQAGLDRLKTVSYTHLTLPTKA